MRSGVEEGRIIRLLSKYKNISATKKDVIDVLENYPSLRYHYEPFAFKDGRTVELFNLAGTIPVVYKGSTYYIPIIIWLMDTHPNNAPMCYVKPTNTMQIKVSMYVDCSGKIYLPYLHEWQPQTSDLLSLIHVMIVTFGEHPPVYSKPKKSVTPYPVQNVCPEFGNSSKNTSFPPYPPTNSLIPEFGNQSNNPSFPFSPPGNNFGSFGPPYPTSNTGQGMHQAGPGYPPYMMPTASGYNSNYNPGTANQTGTITEEHIKASLISAVEDKLRRQIQERVNQCHAEIQTLKRTKQELTEGRSKIDSIILKLEREEVELKKNIAFLRDKEQELEKSLESLEKVDGIDVDEAVITTAPLYRQLLNAYAEEAATEDAIYYLGEALRSGVIDLEVFLKHVRQLSRKQFMLRALMQKCRQKAGLAC